MRIITQIIAVIAICFVIITAAWSVYFYSSSGYSDQQDVPYVYFSKDLDERTLTVIDTENIDLNWHDISVYEGEANLPTSGIISVNDVITDCYGTVNFKLPDGSVFGGWDFGERSFVYSEDIRFIGEWGGDGQDLNFYPNGTYYNYMYWDADDDYENQSGIQLNQGFYKLKTDKLLLEEEVVTANADSYECEFSFSDDDTELQIQCITLGLSYNLVRNFTTDLYMTILNASEKLDDCLSLFISNYSNDTHLDALSQGFNTTVVFKNELTQENINNLTNINIVFNRDSNGDIIYNGFNYSVKIDSLKDLYYLVSRADVKIIISNDSKFNEFGCSI